MFSTNGYRMFAMTQSNTIARARRAIAMYEKAIETGVNFDGTAQVDATSAQWLRQMIGHQHENIAEAKAMKFMPGEW